MQLTLRLSLCAPAAAVVSSFANVKNKSSDPGTAARLGVVAAALAC